MNDVLPNEEAAHRATPGGNPPAPAQPLIGSSEDEKPTREARKHGRRRKFKNAPVWIEAFAAIALVGITFTYTYYARKQANAAHDTLGEIIKQYPELKKSADAALKANEISSESLYAVQRAYVVFDHINGERIQTLIPIGTNIWHFNPIWENAGNTPATPAIHDFFTQLLSDEPNENRFIGKESEYPEFQIGPHAHLGGTVRNIQESELLKARVGIDNGTKFIAWGWFVYRDVFPKSESHVTEFCAHLKEIGFNQPIQQVPGLAPILPPGSPNVTWVGCKHHNCVDRNCKDYEQITALLPK
jgi:hypothetical protein